MTWDAIGEGDADELWAVAPEALAAFDGMVAAVARVPNREIVELTRGLVAQVHGVVLGGERPGELGNWSISPAFTGEERACLGFAEQFVIDVAAIDDGQRAELGAALGDDLFEYVQALYVLDHGTRVVAAVAQLFGVELTDAHGSVRVEGSDGVDGSHGSEGSDGFDGSGRVEGSDGSGVEPGGMWPSIDGYLTEVGRLWTLDPLLTELIRLRGARAHRCRLCQSRRSRSALSADGGEQAIDVLDDYEASDLPERQKVALRLTDAIVWQPTAYPPALVAQVREAFTPAEALEIVLDVSRNAANKIAVALAADQANVTDGVEYFDLEPDGSLVYGLRG
jgi:alkylhydroperoxidase family enzyme